MTIILKYEDGNLQETYEENFKIYCWNETEFIWELVDTSKVNPSENIVTAEISHFSVYRILSPVATCILIKPNPYNPMYGNLTFYGNGIVSDNTEIKIFTLSGELVRTLKNQYEWDGTNEGNKPVTNGIYIYTYESSNEKGIGKLTLLRK